MDDAWADDDEFEDFSLGGSDGSDEDNDVPVVDGVTSSAAPFSSIAPSPFSSMEAFRPPPPPAPLPPPHDTSQPSVASTSAVDPSFPVDCFGWLPTPTNLGS